MLRLSKTVLDQPILSLQTGVQIATSTRAIINPNNLKIEGFYVSDRSNNNQQLILLTQDIRELSEQGLLVNDYSVFSDPKDLVRLEKVLEIDFTLIGKPVQTVSKETIGKVSDFAMESSSFYVQKIYVSRSVLKSFSGASLSIDRTQIHEITNRRIIINDLLDSSPAGAPAVA